MSAFVQIYFLSLCFVQAMSCRFNGFYGRQIFFRQVLLNCFHKSICGVNREKDQLQLLYFHVPRQMSKSKQGKKMSGLGIWAIGRSFLQLSAGRIFYILVPLKIMGKNAFFSIISMLSCNF